MEEHSLGSPLKEAVSGREDGERADDGAAAEANALPGDGDYPGVRPRSRVQPPHDASVELFVLRELLRTAGEPGSKEEELRRRTQHQSIFPTTGASSMVAYM